MLDIKHTVKQVTGCSPDDIPDWVLNSEQPLVLKDFGQEWPIVKAGKQSSKAACDYIRSLYADVPVTAYYGDPEINGRVFYNDQVDGFNYRASKVNLNMVLDKLLAHQEDVNPPTMYIGSTEVTSFLPGFKEQHPLSLDKFQPLTSIWIGNQSKIAAHFDFPNNLACSVVGRRRFTLFPPEQIGNLYIGPMEFAPGGQDISMVDFAQPDFAKYPKFKKAMAAAQVADLEPGDALFLPSMWWHHVQGIDAINMLVTHWWRDSPAFMGRPNNALLMSILALRNLPKAQRQAWKSMFEHYVFDHEQADNEHIPESAQGRLAMPMDDMTARKIRAELLEKLKR